MTICCHDRHRWSGHPLGRARPASYPVLVHRLAPLLHASFRPRLAATPLRFAITSPLSGCEEDLHLQAVEHARRTKEKGRPMGHPWRNRCVIEHLLAVIRKAAGAVRRAFA